MREVSGYDVVVAGSGAAGLTGALRAAERGLRVLVLEKAEVCGGTAAVSGGVLWGATTEVLDRAGHPDDPELARTYLRATVGERTPQELQEAFLASLRGMFGWLEGHDVTFRHMTAYPDYQPGEPGALPMGRGLSPDPVTREQLDALPHGIQPRTPRDGGPTLVLTDDRVWGGRALTARLLAACDRAGVEVWTSSPFVELIETDGRVTGVVARRGEETVAVPAPAGVLLASGGFDHDAELRTAYSKGGRAEWSLGVDGNTGEALRAGLAAGAATDLLEDAWWAPAVLHPDGRPAFLLFDVLGPVGIMVDRDGRRWCNEGTPYTYLGHEWVEVAKSGRPVLPCWFVFDQRALEAYGAVGLRPDDDQEPWTSSGSLVRGETLADLAAALGAPELAPTVERWNELAERGVDEDFGRGEPGSFERRASAIFLHFPGVSRPHPWPNPCLAPLEQGPYYAMQVVLSDIGTKGGLVCGPTGRVTRPDGSAVEGLYACGNAMATPLGHAYPGPGSPITPGMAFGMLAADDMAQRLVGTDGVRA